MNCEKCYDDIGKNYCSNCIKKLDTETMKEDSEKK